MKFPLSWLKQYIALPECSEKVAHDLTAIGIEVDAFYPKTFLFSGVVVVQVLKTRPHPNADRLTIATVTDGVQELDIVCGASNCRSGICVALAPIGATLSISGKQVVIEEKNMRGVASPGMLCSQDELGLPGSSTQGILELEAQAPLGALLSDFWSDTLFEVSLTPNLGYCASIVGIARELAALYQKEYIQPSFVSTTLSENGFSESFTLDNQRPEICPVYGIQKWTQVRVAPSPDWLRRRIEDCGCKSINNVVDITNYVMLELGQPLHAFDSHKIVGDQLSIRLAHEQEPIRTLDGKEHLLSSTDLVIADAHRAIAIAGVIGGIETAVTENSSEILIEAAFFEPSSVRKTAKTLGIRTDASWRFERGTSPSMVEVAMSRAKELLISCAGAYEEKKIMYTHPCSPKPPLLLRLDRLDRVIGHLFSIDDVEKILSFLQFKVERKGERELMVRVPDYRHDIIEEIDLMEEVVRMYGYHRLPYASLPYRQGAASFDNVYLCTRLVKNLLVAQGLQEVITCDLRGKEMDAWIPVEQKSQWISVLKPSSEEQSILRPSLLPGLMQLTEHHFNHHQKDLCFFEIGHVYWQKNSGYEEKIHLAILLTGHRENSHWNSSHILSYDFFYLKGILDSLMESFNLHFSYVPSVEQVPFFHSQIKAKIKYQEKYVGDVAQLHPKKLQTIGIRQPIYYAELDLSFLMKTDLKTFKQYQMPSIYPGTERDWTVTVPKAISYSQLESILKPFKSEQLQRFELVSVYQDPRIGEDKQNITFRFFYQSAHRTLSFEEVEQEHHHLMESAIQSIHQLSILG